MSFWGKVKQAGRWVDDNITQPAIDNPTITQGPIGDALRDRKARSRKDRANQSAKDKAAEYEQEYGDWRSRWDNVNDLTDDTTGKRTRTGERYDDLAGLYTGEVDRGMYDAGSRVADSYARRGMSDSGYAAGGQSDVISQAAAARAAAREAAMKEAVGEGMQIGLGELGAIGAQAGVAMDPYRIAQQQAYQEMLLQQQDSRAQRDEYMKLLASLAGGA